jgi:hypothetical protein
MPAALEGVVSTCANFSGDNPEVMVIYNLKDDVLALSPTTEPSLETIKVYPPSAAGPLPSWDNLEIAAQNAVVSSQQHSEPGKWLLPVGGAALVFLNGTYQRLSVTVSMDPTASALSYAAQLLTGFVADNLRENVSVLDYGSSIVDCVNAAPRVWQTLAQGAAPVTTMVAALQKVQPCTSLAEQVQENRAEALAAVSANTAVETGTLETDLTSVAERAAAPSWESTMEELASVAADIAEITHG